MTPETFQAVKDLGVMGLLAFALIANYRGMWVSGREYASMVADRDSWKQMALTSVSTNERAAGAIEKQLSSNAADQAQRVIRGTARS